MSVAAVQWALETEVGDSTAKLVLLALADEADAVGVCWPFYARLATRAEVSEKTVSRKIAFLEDAGLLVRSERRRRRSGRLSGYSYTLALGGPPDTMSGGQEPTAEDAPGPSQPDAPTPQGRDTGRDATRDHGAPPAAEPAGEPTTDVAGADQPADPPPDKLSGGPADNGSRGPVDTAVSGGPPDTQVSGGKDLDPPCTDPPPPPTPSTGGGGSGDAGEPSPPLAAVLDRIDDDLRRRRFLAEPASDRRRVEVLLLDAVAHGWPPDQLAAAVTDAPFDRVVKLSAVLAKRIREVGATPPAPRPARPADLVPPEILRELEKRAADDSIVGDVVDPQLRRRRLDELVDDWLTHHGEESA